MSEKNFFLKSQEMAGIPNPNSPNSQALLPVPGSQLGGPGAAAMGPGAGPQGPPPPAPPGVGLPALGPPPHGLPPQAFFPQYPMVPMLPPANYFNHIGQHHPHAVPGGPCVQPRRKNATRETTMLLKQWLNANKRNPYPSKGQKVFLAVFTCMSMTQVSTWFANARRRLKKENKMTWSPRNRCDDDDDDDDDLDRNSNHQDQDNEQPNITEVSDSENPEIEHNSRSSSTDNSNHHHHQEQQQQKDQHQEALKGGPQAQLPLGAFQSPESYLSVSANLQHQLHQMNLSQQLRMVEQLRHDHEATLNTLTSSPHQNLHQNLNLQAHQQQQQQQQQQRNQMLDQIQHQIHQHLQTTAAAGNAQSMRPNLDQQHFEATSNNHQAGLEANKGLWRPFI